MLRTRPIGFDKTCFLRYYLPEASAGPYGGAPALTISLGAHESVGIPARALHELPWLTQQIYQQARERKPSPRLKLAQRLYTSGAVPTKRAAAEAAGLNPGYFYLMTSQQIANPELHLVKDDIDAKIHDQTVNMSKVLELLGRKAVGKINEIMSNEAMHPALQLKAAQDLADRAPSTSKTIKHAIAAVQITGKDAKELAASLVESARSREQYSHVAEGDFVRVDTEQAATHVDVIGKSED